MSNNPDHDDDLFSNMPVDPEDMMPAKFHGGPPAFDTLMHPIRMVCDRTSYINGFRFEFAMGLSEKFQMVHTWNLLNKSVPSKNPMKPEAKSTYEYQLSYGIPNLIRPDVAFMASGAGDGKLQAFVVSTLSPELTLKVGGVFMNSNVQQGMLTADLDYENKNSNVGLQFQGGFLNFSWMEKVHRHLSLGFSYLKATSQSMSAFGAGAKLNFSNQNFYIQYLPNQALFMMGHDLRLKNKFKFVTSFTYQQMKSKSTAMIGINKKFAGNQLTATINSRGKVSTNVSMMLGDQFPLKIKLCSIVDYLKDSYKFGYGLSIGG